MILDSTSTPNHKTPKVSIGIPVFNGENYLQLALDSLLAQTYEDFELIISDNASEDRTQVICESYARRDKRIRYFRNTKNIGANANYNLILGLARGEYFKWAAHDDVCSKDFLKSCVEKLDQDPSVVMCHGKEIAIDHKGDVIPNYMDKYDKLEHLDCPQSYKRFYDISCGKHACYQIFGVIRRSCLEKTKLFGCYVGSDRVLLSELALHGKYWASPEPIYFRRHAEQYCALTNQKERAAWYSPKANRVSSNVQAKLFVEYFRSIYRAPLKASDRGMCDLVMIVWLKKKAKRMAREMYHTFRENFSALGKHGTKHV